MHYRRLVCFLLGMWLGCGFFMAVVATQNFRGVDRVLANPAMQARGQIATLGHDSARLLLRYQVSELNRRYFETWEIAQLALGAAVLFVLLFGTGENQFSLLLAALMLAIVAADRFFLTPQIVERGRLLDFVPQGNAPERAGFWVLHAAYSGLEVLKWALGGLLLARLLLRGRSGNAGKKIDLVDKPDYGHVNR